LTAQFKLPSFVKNFYVKKNPALVEPRYNVVFNALTKQHVETLAQIIAAGLK
jgi:hypothetical protein